MPILRHLNISPNMFKANFCTLLSSFFKLSVPQNKRILSFTIINSDQSQADHKSGFLIFVFFTFRLSFCITYLTPSVACRSYMTIFSVANERFWEPQFPSCPSTSAGWVIGPRQAWVGFELSNFGEPSAWSRGCGEARCPSELLAPFYGSSRFLTIIQFLSVYSRVAQESVGLLVRFYGFAPFFPHPFSNATVAMKLKISTCCAGLFSYVPKRIDDAVSRSKLHVWNWPEMLPIAQILGI